jgi:hypothetical protein
MFKHIWCFFFGHVYRERRFTGRSITFGAQKEFLETYFSWDLSHTTAVEFVWVWNKTCPRCGKNLPWNNKFAEETVNKMEQME